MKSATDLKAEKKPQKDNIHHGTIRRSLIDKTQGQTQVKAYDGLNITMRGIQI